MKRLISLLLIPFWLAGAFAPHSHVGIGAGEPHDHAARPHVHLGGGHGHAHGDAAHHGHQHAAGDGHHHHGDDASDPAPHVLPVRDHDDDAYYLADSTADHSRLPAGPALGWDALAAGCPCDVPAVAPSMFSAGRWHPPDAGASFAVYLRFASLRI